jgi:hypothetical protein
MKKILSILALAASVTLGYSQGTVNFSISSAGYLVSTNATLIGGGIGKTSLTPNSYYYALLTQTYTGAASSTISAQPLTGWTFSGAYATNNSGLFAGGINGGTQAIAGWAPGTIEYVEVVGWSANLGSTWAQIASQLANDNWIAQGFEGNSAVGYVTSGGAGVPATLPRKMHWL